MWYKIYRNFIIYRISKFKSFLEKENHLAATWDIWRQFDHFGGNLPIQPPSKHAFETKKRPLPGLFTLSFLKLETLRVLTHIVSWCPPICYTDPPSATRLRAECWKHWNLMRVFILRPSEKHVGIIRQQCLLIFMKKITWIFYFLW